MTIVRSIKVSDGGKSIWGHQGGRWANVTTTPNGRNLYGLGAWHLYANDPQEEGDASQPTINPRSQFISPSAWVGNRGDTISAVTPIYVPSDHPFGYTTKWNGMQIHQFYGEPFAGSAALAVSVRKDAAYFDLEANFTPYGVETSLSSPASSYEYNTRIIGNQCPITLGGWHLFVWEVYISHWTSPSDPGGWRRVWYSRTGKFEDLVQLTFSTKSGSSLPAQSGVTTFSAPTLHAANATQLRAYPQTYRQKDAYRGRMNSYFADWIIAQRGTGQTFADVRAEMAAYYTGAVVTPPPAPTREPLSNIDFGTGTAAMSLAQFPESVGQPAVDANGDITLPSGSEAKTGPRWDARGGRLEFLFTPADILTGTDVSIRRARAALVADTDNLKFLSVRYLKTGGSTSPSYLEVHNRAGVNDPSPLVVSGIGEINGYLLEFNSDASQVKVSTTTDKGGTWTSRGTKDVASLGLATAAAKVAFGTEMTGGTGTVSSATLLSIDGTPPVVTAGVAPTLANFAGPADLANPVVTWTYSGDEPTTTYRYRLIKAPASDQEAGVIGPWQELTKSPPATTAHALADFPAYGHGTYTLEIEAGNGAGVFVYKREWTYSAPEQTVEFAPPTMRTPVAGDGEILWRWNASAAAGVFAYRLYSYTTAAPTPTVIYEGPALEYLHAGVPNGVQRFAFVTALRSG